MPDRKDDDDNLVPFRLRKKSEKSGGRHCIGRGYRRSYICRGDGFSVAPHRRLYSGHDRLLRRRVRRSKSYESKTGESVRNTIPAQRRITGASFRGRQIILPPYADFLSSGCGRGSAQVVRSRDQSGLFNHRLDHRQDRTARLVISHFSELSRHLHRHRVREQIEGRRRTKVFLFRLADKKRF
jgi:hypothetical protein